MNHTPPIFLSEGKDSTAFYSLKKPDKLVVFVHGFQGTSIGTWNNFSKLTTEDQDFSTTDILYYGYDSLNGQAYDQSLEFLKFLNRYSTPDTQKLTLHSPGKYKKIIIVAHSLGALVVRYALLDAIKDSYPWRNLCKLVLFAPAHNGARIQNLVMMSLPSFTKVIGGIAMFFKPILHDLSIGSPAIEDIRKQTDYYKNSPEHNLLSALTIHAHGDLVVQNSSYCFDEKHPKSPVRESSHMKVCKPKEDQYTLPFEILKTLI